MQAVDPLAIEAVGLGTSADLFGITGVHQQHFQTVRFQQFVQNASGGNFGQFGGFPGALPAAPAPARTDFVNPKVEPGKVKWHESLEEAQAASAKSKKPVFLFQMMGKLDDQFC